MKRPIPPRRSEDGAADEPQPTLDLTAVEWLAGHAPPAPAWVKIRCAEDMAKWSVEWARMILALTRPEAPKTEEPAATVSPVA